MDGLKHPGNAHTVMDFGEFSARRAVRPLMPIFNKCVEDAGLGGRIDETMVGGNN